MARVTLGHTGRNVHRAPPVMNLLLSGMLAATVLRIFPPLIDQGRFGLWIGAAGAAWIVGKTALGLRSDYLAIATLGIAEIVIAVMKNEDWLARGVKNVIGLPRPVPYEVDLQNDPAFVERVLSLGADPVTASSIASGGFSRRRTSTPSCRSSDRRSRTPSCT